MAVNNSESMNMEFAQGSIDRTYIQLTPDRKNVENPPVERLAWPTYSQAEKHQDPPHLEAHIQHAVTRPVERKVRGRVSETR
jgi:hypothetical protein